MTWIKETRQTWADLLFLLEYQTARWDSNIHWLNDFMSICGHAGYNSSCEQPAETNARWCVSVKRLLARCSYFPSLTLRSHTVQLFGLTACQKIFIPSIGKHRFTRAAFQSLDGEMLSVSNSAPIHMCPHGVKGFHRKWSSTHNHKLPDSSLLYQKFNICCELSVADVFYRWSVLIGSKSTGLFLCAEGSGSHVSRRVTSPGIFDIFELLAFTLCAALTCPGRCCASQMVGWYPGLLTQQRCIESVFWFHVFIALQQQA